MLSTNLDSIGRSVEKMAKEVKKYDKSNINNKKLFDKIGQLASIRANKRRHLHRGSIHSLYDKPVKITLNKTTISCIMTEE